MEPENRSQKGIGYSGPGGHRIPAEERDGKRDQSDDNAQEILLCVHRSDKQFDLIEPKFLAFSPGMNVQENVAREDSNKSDRINDHHHGGFAFAHDRNRSAIREGRGISSA